MNDILPAPRQLPPLFVSEDELKAVFAEAIMANKWAADTIGDLWRMGAPHPQQEHKRLILPSQYLAWVNDVLTKAGKPLDAAATSYFQLMGGGPGVRPNHN